ncbi:MAG: hypothetical protein ABIJ27_08845, partial [Candidatus Omnitrophota bacterium]
WDLRAEPVVEELSNAGSHRFFTYRNKNEFPSGSVGFHGISASGEHRAVFTVKNPTWKPLSFKDAQYVGFKKDGSMYRFELEAVTANTGIEKSSVLNPGKTIQVSCRSPVAPADINDIYIYLRRGGRIHFVSADKLAKYQTSLKRTWEDRIIRIKDAAKRKFREWRKR